MQVLVTGGAGFIGSHSVEALPANGDSVAVLDNFSAGKRSNLPSHPGLRIVEGDIRESRMSPLRQEEWLSDRPATRLDQRLGKLLAEPGPAT